MACGLTRTNNQVTITVYYTYLKRGVKTKVFEKTYSQDKIHQVIEDVSHFMQNFPSQIEIILKKSPLVSEVSKKPVDQLSSTKVSHARPSTAPVQKTEISAKTAVVSHVPTREPKAELPRYTKTKPKLWYECREHEGSSRPQTKLPLRAKVTMASAMGQVPIPHESRELKFTPLGGCRGIEASAYLLHIDGHCLLLDAGYREKRPLKFDLLKLHNLEAVFITHAHLDHVGSLPIIHRMFPSIPIYMTAPTKVLASTILHDAMNVASLKGIELYTKDEIEETLNHVVSVDFDQEFDFEDLRIVFRRAGHILGAASILIQGRSKVLYTGDFSTTAFFTTPAAYLPNKPEPLDLLVLESTYGNSSLPPRKSQVDEFCSEVKKILQRGGRVLIPSFALGRAQEISTILLKEIEEGTIEAVPVILDGMARTVCEQYDDFSDYLPGQLYRTCRRSKCLRPVGDSQNRERIVNDSSPCIIVASSGMLTGGPSVAYAEKILLEDKSAILIVGYQDEEAPGLRIKNSKLGQPIELIREDGEKVTITRRCAVSEYRLSAHSDQQELVRFTNSYDPLAIFLVHGETKAKMPLAKALVNSGRYTILVPENGEEIDVDTLIRLWEEIKLAEARGLQGDVDELCENLIEKIHILSSNLTFEVFKDSLTKSQLLARCGSLTKAKDTMYRLFAWSLKYAKTAKGIDFQFPANIMGNGALFISLLFGKRFGKRFLREFQRTLPAMFKNLILFGGPKKIRTKFPIYIESKSQLYAAIKNFNIRFSKLQIEAPDLFSIEAECRSHVDKTRDAKIKKRFAQVFGEELTKITKSPVTVLKRKEAEKIEPTLKKEKEIAKVPGSRTSLRQPKATKVLRQKEIALPVISEDVIGLGKYKVSVSRDETSKEVPEVREMFLTTEQTCVFCGSTKLKLLKVVNIDPKMHRKEYSCEDCSRVFAVRSPSL
jgi:Cft2 family RNA processing exonuclease